MISHGLGEVLVPRFINAISLSLLETEGFHGGLRPYGAPSRSCCVIPLNPAGGAAAPARPLGVRPIHIAYGTEFVKGRAE